MKLSEVKSVLIDRRPNGISFDGASLRSLKKEMPELSDWMLERLKEEMFRRSDGAWLFAEQVADDDVRSEILDFAESRLRGAGYITIGRITTEFENRLRKLENDVDFTAFFSHCLKNKKKCACKERRQSAGGFQFRPGAGF